MADSRAFGSAGEPAVRDQGDALSQLLVGGDGFRGVEHLRHTAALGALIADEHRVPRPDGVAEHRRDGVLLTVKGPGVEHGHVHFLRNRGVLHHGPLRRQVALQDGNGSLVTDGFIVRVNDLFLFESRWLQKPGAVLVEAVFLQLIQVFAQGLSGDGHYVQVQAVADLLHHCRNSARVVEIGRRPLPGRAYVEQVVGALVDALEGVRVDGDTELVGDGRQVEQGVGGAGNSSVDHDGVLKAS